MELKDAELWRCRAYVDGDWINAQKGNYFSLKNPASGESIAEISDCGVTETRQAIEAAARSFGEWNGRTAAERAGILQRMFVLMKEHREDLARIITLETAKPLKESRQEIDYGADYLRWFAAEAERVYGDVLPSLASGQKLFVFKQAVGVVACITPWNFPSALLVRKLAPALAVGCTVVCKPASETPLSAFAIAEIAARAGVPAGVLNIVAGRDVEIGAEMSSNPLVRKLTFTGSTRVGKILLQQCAGTVKNTSMELGGNAPFVVFEDADLELAVEGALRAKYRNAGQTCICANRLLVQESIHDEFAARMSAEVGRMRLGNGMDETVDIGPLISSRAADQVMALMEDALAQGARATVGGGRGDMGATFVEPSVLTGIVPGMQIFHQEIFGPVAPLVKFRSEAEAIALANDTRFGLAAYCFTRDVGRVFRLADALECGMVAVNSGAISSATIPFGGVKESGMGREGSKYGVDDYLEIKYVSVGGLQG